MVSKLFLPTVEEMCQTEPVILFFDGHQSHATLPLVDKVKEYGIILFTFSPHTTHILQPLNMGVFGPLKKVWSQVLKTYKLKQWVLRLTRNSSLRLLAKCGRPPSSSQVSHWRIQRSWDAPTSERCHNIHKVNGISPLSSLFSITFSIIFTFSIISTCSTLCATTTTYCGSNSCFNQYCPIFGDIFIQNCQVTVQQRRSYTPRHYGVALTEDLVCLRLMMLRKSKFVSWMKRNNELISWLRGRRRGGTNKKGD